MWLEFVLESFQVHVCFGAVQRLWSILELMDEETRICSRNQSQSRESEGVSTDTAPLVSRDTIAMRWTRLVRDRLKPRSHHILQEFPWPTY